MFKAKSIIVGLIIDSFVFVALLCLVCIILTKLGIYPRALVGVILSVIVSIAAFSGGTVSAKLAGEKGIIYGILNGFIFLIAICIYSLVLYTAEPLMKTAGQFLLVIPSSAIGGIVGIVIHGKRQYI